MPTQESARVSRYAAKLRREILDTLGNQCWACGNKYRLQIDHIHGRDYQVNRLSYVHRHIRYRRELKEGKIRILCEDCNCGHQFQGVDLPHPTKPF